MHKAVLHVVSARDGYGCIVPAENMPQLRQRLYLSLAYTEVVGGYTYDHYDVWGVRRGSKGTGKAN